MQRKRNEMGENGAELGNSQNDGEINSDKLGASNESEKLNESEKPNESEKLSESEIKKRL